jgi:small-conductance mechanosensitive channel
MAELLMFKIIGIILVIAFITALFVFYRYRGFKKVLESKPASARYRIYAWIAFKFLISIGCVYYIWITEAIDIWLFLCLAYLIFSIALLLFILNRINKFKNLSD